MLATTRFDSAQNLADTLTGYVRLYNHQIPQKALGHIAPIQALKDWQQTCPERFKKRVYNLTGLDKFVGGSEAPAFEQAVGEDAEPDLDLVEPGTVLGGVDKTDAVGGILEKGGAGGHALEDAGLAFAPQIGLAVTSGGDERDQAGGLVGIQLVGDENPLAQRIGLHGARNVRHEVGFGAGVADGGGDDAPGGDLELGDQRLGAVTLILEFDRLGVAWAQVTIRL